MELERKTWYLILYELEGKDLAIFSEAPNGEAPEEVEKIFKNLKPFGFKIKSVQLVTWNKLIS